MGKTILSYTEKSLGSINIFHLNGNIMGEHDTSELCSRIKELIEADKKYFVIDLKNVKWINSNGIGAMLGCLTTSRNKGGDIRFANAHDATKRYFQVTKLETVIDIFDTIEEAVESFGFQNN